MTTVAPPPPPAMTGHAVGELETELDERVIAQNALTSASEELQALCATHAGTFVAVERRGRSLASCLSGLLSALTESEPKVLLARRSLVSDDDDDDHGEHGEQDRSNSATSLAVLAERHRLRRRTLLQHSALLELLELPSLMDACVRSDDLYDEALSIAAFANTLERRHLSPANNNNNNNSNNSVVRNVVGEVRRRESDLKRQLLSRLRGNVSMSQCLDVVTALRRLNGVELERQGGGERLEHVHAAMELRLQVDFFEARDAWLDSPAISTSDKAAAPRDNTPGRSELLLDSIERYRTRCFEIATQFLAIFRANSNNNNNNNTNKATPLSLLSLWTDRRVHDFLASLSRRLDRVDTMSDLRDALDATVFFATSLGRIGADFQALLPPIFAPRSVAVVTAHWDAGVERLDHTLTVCRDAGVAGPLYAGLNDHHASDVTGDVTTTTDLSSSPPPPRTLSTLPPLARLLNSILEGLNELRRCLLPQAFPLLRRRLEDTMNRAKTVLEANDRSVNMPRFKGEAVKLRETAKEMRKQFETCLEPYCRSALDFALGVVPVVVPVPTMTTGPTKEEIVKEKEAAVGVEDSQDGSEQATDAGTESPVEKGAAGVEDQGIVGESPAMDKEGTSEDITDAAS